MAIHCVFGLPGAGKTTYLTMLGSRCIAGKSPGMGIPVHSKVFSNFELAGAYKLDFDTLGIYLYEDALILIDEIMLLADSRNFKDFPESLKYFFSHHRKFNCTVVYCSQSWQNMDKRIRELTDHYFLLTRGKVLDCFSICKPIVHKFNVENMSIVDGYELGAPVTWVWCYRPRYYSMFDTYFGVRDLPTLEWQLWADAPKKEKLWKRLTDWEKSPVLRLLRRIYDATHTKQPEAAIASSD